MKVTFEVNEVLPKLVDVASVINSKNGIAILSDVCITVSGESIIFTASDGENWVTERADILASDMEAMFCTVAKDFIGCLSSLRDENVTVTLDGEAKVMTLDYVSGKINLPYENADDFQKPNISVEGASEFIVSGAVVKNAIKIASASTENSVVRPIMSGVHFGFSGGKMIVNSASHIRVVKIVEDASLNEGAQYDQFTLPPKAYSVIASVLDGVEEDVKLKFNDKVVSVSNRNFKITARLLEGRYPDCDMVIPKNNTVNVEVEKERMLQALKHVLSIDNTNRLVVLAISVDAINVSAEDVNFGRNSEEAVVCKNYYGNEITICFNGEVLSETLRSIDGEEVMFEMSEPMKPAIVCAKEEEKRGKYMSVLMPMVIQAPVVQ